MQPLNLLVGLGQLLLQLTGVDLSLNVEHHSKIPCEKGLVSRAPGGGSRVTQEPLEGNPLQTGEASSLSLS